MIIQFKAVPEKIETRQDRSVKISLSTSLEMSGEDIKHLFDTHQQEVTVTIEYENV